MTSFHPLTVSQVENLTTQSVAISFEIPAHLQSDFTFQAGQYITIKHKIHGKEVRRAYSISSAPAVSGPQASITVGIKEVAGGAFSPYANRYIQKGDVLEIMPPQGRFLYAPTSAPVHILGVAAGSGITPILSIAKSVLASGSKHTFTLIYGNKSPQDVMFSSEVETLKAAYPNQLKIQWVYSQAKEENSLFGRIDTAAINYLLKNIDTDPFDAAYLCGPEGMIKTATESLEKAGLATDQIHYELFTVATESTTEAGEATESALTAGNIAVEVTVDGETSTIEMDAKTILLDAIIKADIDAPYSCQGGVCSSCICKVTKGSASMIKNQILTDSEIADGLVLSCQAMVTSTEIAVDFDDV
jgi:ring-1,2-phenylacetyl-CoA epoxidase subunit PaaE